MDREKGVERVVEKRWLEHVGLEWTPNFHYPPITAGEVSGQQHHPTKSNSKPQTPNPKKINNGHLYCFLFSSTFFTYLSPPDFSVIVWLIWLWKLTTHSPVDSCGRRWSYNYWDLSEWVFWSFTTVMLLSELVLNSEKSENFLPFPEWKCRPS